MQKLIIWLICLSFYCLSEAAELTVCSYNCGGLSDHYDYLRAAVMQKLMQERYTAEPEMMSLNEKIQGLALKILFCKDSEKDLAQQEWETKGYTQLVKQLIASPNNAQSLNTPWQKRAHDMITFYNIRPVVIADDEVNLTLDTHLKEVTASANENRNESLKIARKIMAKRIFHHVLKYDIICLQEADYLDTSLFPKHFNLIFSSSPHSKNAVAWNTDRFDLQETIEEVEGRAFLVILQDKFTDKLVAISSAHLTGCNPFEVEIDSYTQKPDSDKGDREAQKLLERLHQLGADLTIIGIDSNVTSLHPRLNFFKNAGYQLDYENFLEPTCSNPHQVLNTRIDWIMLKSKTEASIVNIPVLDVGLNQIQTNISDHKPIAAKIVY